MKTSVAISERNCSAARSGAPLSSARFASLGRSVTLDLEVSPAELSRELDPSRLGAEAHQLRVVAAAGREALRTDVQRLEQVRLAGSVLADGQHQSRLESQLERGVGAVVAERERADDQPFSRPAGWA